MAPVGSQGVQGEPVDFRVGPVDQAAWVGFQDQVGFQALRVALVVPALAAHRDAQADSQGREVEALRRAQASQEVAESTKSNSPRKAIQKSNSEKSFREANRLPDGSLLRNGRWLPFFIWPRLPLLSSVYLRFFRIVLWLPEPWEAMERW